MIIRCNKCQKQYKVNPDKITEKGTKITCPACGHNFIVRRKAEAPAPAPPKMKTPPCKVCGQPSTHVLKGDPPLVLCERCFQVEKEKATRFSPEAFEASAGPETPEERPDLTEAPPEPPRKVEEGEYFDTFDEIPDIPDEEAQTPVVSAVEGKESRPEAATPAADSEARFTDPFAREHSAFALENEAEPPAPPPARPATPPPAVPPAPATTSTPVFDYPDEDVSMQPEAPPEKPRPPAPPVAKAPAAALPVQGRFSLEEEVERSLEQETVQKAAAPVEGPVASVPAAARKHWPAYALSAGVMVLVLLAAGYFLLRQRTPGPAPTEVSQPSPAPATPPEAAAPAPSPAAAPGPLTPAAPAAEPAKPEVAGQVKEKLKLYRDFFTYDTLDGYQKALQVLDQAQALDPQNVQIEAMRIETHAFMASLTNNFLYTRAAKKLLSRASAAVQAEPAYQRSQIHLYLVDRDTAAGRTALEGYLAQNPEDGIGFYLLGLSYLKDDPPNFAAARDNLQKAVTLDPTLTRAYFEMANQDRAFRRLDDALAEYRQVHKLSPQKKEATQAIAEMEAELKNKNQAAAAPSAPTPVSVPVPTAPQAAPGATSASQPVPVGSAPVPTAAAPVPPSPTSPLAASGDALSDNLREIISEISRPMSRVPAAAKAPAEKPQPPAPPPETIPPEERPPQ